MTVVDLARAAGGPLVVQYRSSGPAGRPVVFLDRDGVLNENRADSYVLSVDDAVLVPGAREAVSSLVRSGFVVVVVTNQACVGKGLISAADAVAITTSVVERVGDGSITAALLCPHTAATCCSCRKPAPGMLDEAARRLDLDVSGAFLVGDALSDAECARRAGVVPVLVRTGRWHDELGAPAGALVHDSLAGFAESLAAGAPVPRRPTRTGRLRDSRTDRSATDHRRWS